MDQFIDTHDTKSRLINYSFNLSVGVQKNSFYLLNRHLQKESKLYIDLPFFHFHLWDKKDYSRKRN